MFHWKHPLSSGVFVFVCLGVFTPGLTHELTDKTERTQLSEPSGLSQMSKLTQMSLDRKGDRPSTFFSSPTFSSPSAPKVQWIEAVTPCKHPLFLAQVTPNTPQQSAPRLSSQGGPIQWQPFISKAGGFRMQLPQGGLVEEIPEPLETSAGKVLLQAFKIETQPALSFLIIYGEYPDSAKLKRSRDQDVLQALWETLVQGIPAQVLSDRPIQLTNFPGREWTIGAANRSGKFRLYLVDRRVYVLGVIQENSGQDGKQTTGDRPLETAPFFDSFTLLSEADYE